MLRGVSTVVYQASDLAAARDWYAQLLGVAPYFNRTEYIEFRIGDYQHELGILDSKFMHLLGGTPASPPTTPSGVIAYWHVDAIPATLERLVALGATVYQPPRDFGEGFIGASVIDPFGNILGIMYNPHYLDVLQSRGD
jgi:predicted enzyme related to lactoylglutathione lyase